jgi:multiple antibiotic resistance protein
MIHWDFAVNVFVARFALIDPIGNVPVFSRLDAAMPYPH